MKKFSSSIALVLSVSLLICSCDIIPEKYVPGTQPDTTDVSIETETETETEVTEEEFVEFTVSSDFVGDTTQEELDQECSDKGYVSCTLNDDGSVTYIMTKSVHDEMMNSLRESINSSINDLIASESCPNVTDIQFSDYYDEFSVYTSNETVGLNESMMALNLYMCSGMYHMFNGDTIDNVHVVYYNSDSGNMLTEVNSSDMSDEN